MKTALIIFLFFPFVGLVPFFCIIGLMGWMMDVSINWMATHPSDNVQGAFWTFFFLFIIGGWGLGMCYYNDIEDALS